MFSKPLWFKRIPDIGEGATFLRKWGLIGILIGIGAGLGALALVWLIHLMTHYVLGTIVGYTPPLPGGEGGASDYIFHMTRPWLLPLVTAGGGLGEWISDLESRARNRRHRHQRGHSGLSC